MINLETIQCKYFNERDIEHPAVIEFVSRHLEAKTLLDFGPHCSSKTYAPELRELLKDRIMEGIDILEPLDNYERSLFDKWRVKNILELSNNYDLITGISAIEHCGINTYKVKDHKIEQKRIFHQFCKITNIAFLLTFPYGLSTSPKQGFANITAEDLLIFDTIAKSYGYNCGKYIFYFNEFAMERKKWTEINKDSASLKPYKSDRGCQTLCIAEYSKCI